MNDTPPALPGLFLTGTDTGVGKTRLAAAIARALHQEGRRVGVLKPVATGAQAGQGGWLAADAAALAEAIGGEVPPDRVAPFVFEAPLAPCVAARQERRLLCHQDVMDAVEDAILWWSTRAEILIVEGVGGLLCPLAEDSTVADLAIALDYPLVIVARRGLGTLNHTLLTVEAARLRGLRIAGVILNGAEPTSNPLAEATNAQELARRLGGIAILGDLPHEAGQQALSKMVGCVDWYEWPRPPRGLRLASGPGPTAGSSGGSSAHGR